MFHSFHSTTILPRTFWRTGTGRFHETTSASSGSPRTALVTGASSGIGTELAKILAENGFNLVLVAHDREQLLTLAAELESRHGITVTAIPCDLSAPDSPSELMSELRQRSISIDVLVNNAGFATSGEFVESDITQTLSLLNVNVVALTQLTRLLVPGMLARHWGRVLNVASIAGFYPGPLTACYNASKAFVISFSMALSNELHGTGVTSCVLCPGPTDTCFAKRARLLGSRAFRRNVMDARTVAKIGYDAMVAGKPMVIAGMRNRLRMLSIPLVPAAVLAHFSRQYHEV